MPPLPLMPFTLIIEIRCFSPLMSRDFTLIAAHYDYADGHCFDATLFAAFTLFFRQPLLIDYFAAFEICCFAAAFHYACRHDYALICHYFSLLFLRRHDVFDVMPRFMMPPLPRFRCRCHYSPFSDLIRRHAIAASLILLMLIAADDAIDADSAAERLRFRYFLSFFSPLILTLFFATIRYFSSLLRFAAFFCRRRFSPFSLP